VAGPERIEWRRGFPSRAVRRSSWYAVAAAFVLGLIWLLFGPEPDRLTSGAINVLALIPTIATTLACAGGVFVVLLALRRPRVAANHYALSVRPGACRSLVLPWAIVDRVAVVGTPKGRYLLVALSRKAARAGRARRSGWAGPVTRWCDQRAMRRLARSGPRGRQVSAGYELAVPMSGFVGGPGALTAAVAAFAPDHVVLAGELDPT
jgi:hypothetical protein